MSLSDRPVYDPNPLRPNPNPKKHVSSSCRVRGLGRTLTTLVFAHLVVVLGWLVVDFAHFWVVGGGLHFSCDL